MINSRLFNYYLSLSSFISSPEDEALTLSSAWSVAAVVSDVEFL